MSGNQKQAAAVGPQQSQRYQGPYIPRPPTPQREYFGTEFHVTTSQTYVPQQPQNQPGGQGPLRTIAPAGPPNQSSTPPTNDLKVQQIPQQSSMGLAYVPQQQQLRGAQPNYFRAQVPNTQTQRMTNHRQGQQPMYPPQFVQVSTQVQPTTLYLNAMPFYNGAGRLPSFVGPAFMPSGHQIPPYNYQPTQSQPQQPTFYFNQLGMQRPAPPVQTGPQNTAQAPPPQMHMPQNTQQHPMQRTNKRRTHALAIINPTTGADMLDELYDSNSQPASGESSARQTPQPPNANKEVQAAFAKQVAMAINNSDPMEMDGAQMGPPPLQQQQQQPQQQHQAPPPPLGPAVVDPHAMLEHPTVVYQQPHPHLPVLSPNPIPIPIPQAVNKLEHVVQYSKLQAQTKEFVPSSSSNQSNLDKEPPVVSALTDGAVVTINKQPKDRESPGKGRKPTREQPREFKEAPQVVVAAVSTPPVVVKEQIKEPSPEVVMVEKPVFVQQQQQQEEVKAKEVVLPVVQQATVTGSTKESKELSNVTQRDEKKAPRKEKEQAKAEVHVESPVVSVQQAPVVAQEHATASGKSKQNASHRNKDAAKSSQPAHPQPPQTNNQKHQPSVAVPPSQPPKPNSKANKIKELNVKGATKEGTDMDAFNDNIVTSSADVLNANVTTNSSAAAPQTTTTATVASVNDNYAVNDSNKSTVETIKPVEVKPAPVKSNKVDVTAIVKDVPKIPKNYNIEPPPSSQDEPDRASLSNEKLVQAKNEVNAKANADSNEEKPNLPYKEDQWSPFNLDGKKVYDRDFLLALKDDPKSKRKPDNIQMDVYKMISRSAGMTGGGRTDFTPSFNSSFMGKSSSQHGVPPKRGSQSKMGGGGGGGNNNKGSKQNLIRVSISVREDVKLHESENAWRPARLNTCGTVTDEDKKTEELYKKVRSVLNKLTPQKFQTLLSQVRNLTIDTTQRLQGVIDLVFEKAVDEPNFSYGYALMCKELALLQVPSTSADGKKKDGPDFVNFRKLLITRCQLEFEKNSAEEIDRNKRSAEIEKCTDPEKKKELQLQLEEDDRRIRRKSVGNIRFLGELFKQNMLTVSIMFRCLENLLENKDEERLECLCKLLTTIGKELEVDKKEDLSSFFNTMKEIVDKKHGKVSSRVRFMLQDVMDLRKSKWVPRRQDVNPKTIDQIQKEAENEQLAIQAMNAMPMPRKDDRSNSGPGSDRKRKNTTDDGWSTQTSRNRPSTFTVQSNKLKNTRPLLDEPLGSRQTFDVWSRGSAMKTYPNPTATPAATVNIYSALENIALEPDKKSTSMSSSRSSSKDPYSSKGHSLERTYKQYNDEGRSSRSGSQHRSNERMNSSTPPSSSVASPAPPKLQAAAVPEPVIMDVDQLERKVKNILDEYWNECYEMEECNQDIKSSIPYTAFSQLVSIGYMYCLERSKSNRLKAGTLFATLINLGTISLEQYCAGLEEVLSQAEDLRIDIPKIYNYLPEMLVQPVCMEVLRLEVLHKSCESLIGQGHAGKLLAPLFKLVVEEKGPDFLQNVWQMSGLKLADFVDASEVDALVKQNQLEFLTGGSDSPIGHSELSYEQVHDKLLQLFKSRGSFDEQVNWIIANVGDRLKEKRFIRTLATAVFEDSIVNYKLNAETLKGHYTLLHRFVDTNPTYELQCLYALQALIHKLEHPQGILLQICGQLYEDGIFSQDSFVTWEASTDLAEMEGKGVALKQLTSFFTQLKENDEEEEDFASSASEDA